MKKTKELLDKEFGPHLGDRHDYQGFEQPDPMPVEMPIGFKKPLSIQEQIARALRSEKIRQAQEARGEETFDDSMDFDTGDEEGLPVTPHEIRDMQEEQLSEAAADAQARLDALRAHQALSKHRGKVVAPVDAGKQPEKPQEDEKPNQPTN